MASQASAFRLATAILAPATPNPSAIALPMPRVPPVMMATRPVRSWRLSSFRDPWCGPCGCLRQLVVEPPLTAMVWPVIHAASLEARKVTA